MGKVNFCVRPKNTTYGDHNAIITSIANQNTYSVDIHYETLDIANFANTIKVYEESQSNP